MGKKQIGNKKHKINIKSASFISQNTILIIDSNHKLSQYSLTNESLASLSYDKNYSKLISNQTNDYIFVIEDV